MLLHWRPLLRVFSDDSRSPSSRVYDNFLCRVGNSKSSFEVNWRLVSGKAVQCRRRFSASLSTGDAANNRGPTPWHHMNPHLNAWRSGLRWRSNTGLTHPPAHAREDVPSLHLCTASRSEDQPEDRSHAWCWMYNILHQSKWTEKTFQQLRSSPTLAASSDMMAERATTLRIASARPETPSEWWIMFGGHPSTASRPNEDCTRAVCFPPYCTVRLGIMEDDGVWREQVRHLPYKEPQKDLAYFLAWDHLQPTTSRPL